MGDKYVTARPLMISGVMGPEHIIPHDQIKVGRTLLNTLCHLNDMTEEQLVNTPTWNI